MTLHHADAAKDDDHEPDQAQIVLGPPEISLDPILGASIRAHAHERFSEVLAEPVDQRLDLALLLDPDQQLTACPTSKRQKPRVFEGLARNEYSWAKAERPQLAPGLSEDHTSYRQLYLPDRDSITHGQIQLCQKLGSNQCAVTVQQVERIGLRLTQRELPVERERGLNRPQLDDLGPRTALLDTPHHRGRVDRLRLDRAWQRVQSSLDRLQDLCGPWPTSSYVDVSRGQGPRLSGQRYPHVLDERAQGDDATHTDRDTEKEKSEPTPRGP